MQAVHHSKYLGVELPSGLNWDVHFAGIIDKAREDKGDREGILHTHPIP